MRTVWIYTDTTKRVGDEDHLRVFESPGVFERWKETNDPEAVAFECVVIEGGTVNKFLGTAAANAAVTRPAIASAQLTTVVKS